MSREKGPRIQGHQRELNIVLTHLSSSWPENCICHLQSQGHPHRDLRAPDSQPGDVIPPARLYKLQHRLSPAHITAKWVSTFPSLC